MSLQGAAEVCKMADGFQLVFKRTLKHPIAKVWSAITEPGEMKFWFTDVKFELKENSPLEIIFRDEARTVTRGEILKVQREKQFTWSWEGELADWSLQPLDNTSCTLTFTYSKLPEQYAVGAAGGFHTIFNRLELYLNGSRKTYPFGTEEHDPEQADLREEYGEIFFRSFPELQVHNPIQVVRTLDHPRVRVWKALTDNEQLKKWYFDFKGQFKAEEGCFFEWTAGPPGGKQWLHRGKVTDLRTPERLVHSWEFPGYEGKATVSWELEEKIQDKTLLRFKFAFEKPFDPAEPELSRQNFVQGWKQIIDQSLPAFLDSQKA